jgi:aminopeptidase N
MSLIGEEAFGKAMSVYFKKYEWSNATLSDFINNLNEYYKPNIEGSPASLDEWQKEWLQHAGLNEATPEWDPKDTSANASLKIKQTVALEAHPTLRHHKCQLAFFNEQAQIHEAKHIIIKNTPETVITYDGSKKSQAVLLNYQDEAFLKVRLDEQSITFFKEKLAQVSDELTRAMVWRALFDMVRDGQLSAYGLAEIAVEGLPKEVSDSTFNNILLYTTGGLSLSPKVLNDNVILPKLFEATLKVLLATDKSSSNRIVLLRENLIKFASVGKEKNIDNVTRLANWLDGTDAQLKDIELDVQNKWSIVHAIHESSKFTNEQKKAYFQKVAEIDSSDRMKLAEKRCDAVRAEGEDRKNLFKSYLDPENKQSVQMFGQSMTGYNASQLTNDEDINQYFDNILTIFKTRNNEFASTYYNSMFPHKENIDEYIQRTTKLLEQADGNDILIRCLKESVDELNRKKKGFEVSAADLTKENLTLSK